MIQEQTTKADLRRMNESADFPVESDDGAPGSVIVLVEFVGPEDALTDAGLEVRTVAGDVVTGVIAIDDLGRLAEVDGVRRVEASRPLHDELDLSLPASNVGPVHAGPPGLRGDGVVVGIIDSGIEIDHPSFLRADGTSRILAIWDQSLTANGNESTPSSFNYGVEYTTTEIDAEIAAGMPGNIVRHRDSPFAAFHGTHVAGIAAGDGSAVGPPPQNQPAFTFVGVAPEADIVVVRNLGSATGIGDSANTVDAVRYIFDLAATAGKPAVINQSQGDNIGPHDGTSLLERAIDNMLGGRGRAMVKSAGNAANDRIHASGTVPLLTTETVRFSVPANRNRTVTLDLWYDGSDRFDVRVVPPGSAESVSASPGDPTVSDTIQRNRISVTSDVNDPANADNRIFVQIQPTGNSSVLAGVWQLQLTGTRISDGRFDAWIQRGRPTPTFVAPHENPNRTISTPGTAREIITAASYINRGPGQGSISTFSSLGPTRDGRQAPTVAAPGERVISASPLVLPANSPPNLSPVYRQTSGTSMAAPHVAGAVALMLQQNPQLTQLEVKRCLERSAASTPETGATPNNAWGHGILDVAGAVRCRPPSPATLSPPCLPSLRPPCVTLRPPCNIVSLTVPCLPSLRPPCIRTLSPPCPPRPSLTVPCAPSLRPPCPQPTLGPPCPQPTLNPPCRFTPVPGPETSTDGDPVAETAAGWGPVSDGEAAGTYLGYDPAAGDSGSEYDLLGYDLVGYDPEAWSETGWAHGDAVDDDSGFGSTDAWYGNEGYGR